MVYHYEIHPAEATYHSNAPEKAGLYDKLAETAVPVATVVPTTHDDTPSTSLQGEDLLAEIGSGIIGRNSAFETPFGARPIVYADYTASGRTLQCIEHYMETEVLPQYGNTHTTTSITGLQSTCFRREAREIIAQCVNATNDDVVLFAGSGSTSAIHKLVHILGLQAPIPHGSPKPVVFVGPFEHHSNLLSWRETSADVVQIGETADGTVDLAALKLQLTKYADRPLKIGSFSAASNLTGVLTDVTTITCLLHEHGALSFWDYAAAAPYESMDMNPVVDGPSRPFVYKDAIFLSGHKFLGGPGSPGVLVVKRHLVSNPVPTIPGGGTVFYVTEGGHRYLSSLEEREEGGTPDTLGSIRLGLAFQIKQRIGTPTILDREHRHVERVLAALQNHSRIVLLGPATMDRLPIFSFLVRAGSRFLHYNFVCALLNDLFGVQSRGGCQCAGPYGQRLLGIPPRVQGALEAALLDKAEVLRPGMSRVSFPYIMDDSEVDYILAAINFVATEGWKFLPQYRFKAETGEWKHRTRVDEFPTRKWLSDASFLAHQRPPAPAPLLATYQEYLVEAKTLAERALSEWTCAPPTVTDALDATKETLRWFVYPSEVLSGVQDGALPLQPLVGPVQPHVYGAEETAASPEAARGDVVPIQSELPPTVGCRVFFRRAMANCRSWFKRSATE